MKKYLVLIIIFVIISLVAATYLFLQNPESQPNFECTKNSDCKLIYSSCGCKATPITDTRTYLDNGGIICVRNNCDGLTGNVTAICENNKCVSVTE